MKKSIDGVLGIRTRGRRMVGADETMELWRPPIFNFFVKASTIVKKWANPGLFLFTFVHFLFQQQTLIQFQHFKLKKALMVCLGFEPGAAEWCAQIKPRSYGGLVNCFSSKERTF